VEILVEPVGRMMDLLSLLKFSDPVHHKICICKSKENRETFICASEEDQEAALIWLRNEMN
jgi:hypothetical protein